MMMADDLTANVSQQQEANHSGQKAHSSEKRSG